MFRYLSAEDICKFFDKFEYEVIKRSGLDADQLGELSRTEINQMLNAIFDDVVMTKDNIYLYYEFMGDEDKKIEFEILNPLFYERALELDRLIFLLGTEIGDKKKYVVIDKISSLFSINLVSFGVKDTLKPIDEYIAEIKASKEYQEYMATSLSIEEKRAYTTGEMPNSPNYKKQCAINRLRG